MISTLAMRMGMFYFVVMAQKNTATLANHNPRYQELMVKKSDISAVSVSYLAITE